MSISILGRIGRLLLRPSVETRRSPTGMSQRCDPAAARSSTLLGNLSGGNQQKVALAKWLT